MKLIQLCILWLLTVILLTSSGGSPHSAETTEFTIDYYNLSFTTPSGWEKTDSPNFDIQCSNQDANFSVFAFYTIDLAKDETPDDIYNYQTTDILTKRDNPELIKEMTEKEVNDKIIKTILYSAERDGQKNYYYSCLVEFKDNPDIFAWVLINGYPSYIAKNETELLQILETMEYTPK